jgi:hypothetical protein
MKLLFLLLAGTLFLLSSCAMLRSWRSIPAPGGCEECHKVPISSNWQITFKPATLTDERHRESFQTPERIMPAAQKPASPLDKQKVEELACFDCHTAPNDSHKNVKGKFHH